MYIKSISLSFQFHKLLLQGAKPLPQALFCESVPEHENFYPPKYTLTFP